MATIAAQSFSRLVGVRKNRMGDAVDLRRALADPSLGGQVLDNFRFISAHLDALRTFANSARSGGAMMLCGAGGTGKSSLLYLMHRILTVPYPSDHFYDLCQAVREEYVVKALAGLRTEGRRWLAVLPDFSGGDFSSAMRTALGSALLSCKKTCDFAPKPSDLIQEYVETLTHLHLQGSIDGLLILADNFDNIFDECLADGSGENARAVRDFISLCSESSFPLFFVGSLQRDVSTLDINEDAFLTDVFHKVQPVNLLGKAGEWEDLVAHAVLCHPDAELWNEAADYQDFQAVAEATAKQELYAGCSEKWLTETVVSGTYPLHPAALFALPRVAMSLRSGKKTALRFFTDICPGSLAYFLNNYAVVQPNGRLHLYTVDWLCTYFEKAIQEDKQNKFYTSALQNAILAAGDVPQSRRILRLIMILQLIGHEHLRPQLETILWALHLGEREERTVRNSLNLLLQRKALELYEATQEYLLPVPKRDVNVPQAIQRSRKRMRSQLDLRQELQSGLPTLRVKADGFNEKHYTDRYATMRAYLSSDISDTANFMRQVDELLDCRNPYRGDMLFAYVIPDSANDRDAVVEQICQGKYNNRRLVMIVPREAHRFAKDILEVRTLERMLSQEAPFSVPNSAEHAQVAAMLNKVTASLDTYGETLLDHENTRYYYNGELLEFSDEEQVQEWLDNRLPEILGALPDIASSELMSLGNSGTNRSSRLSLTAHLLASGESIALHNDAEALLNMIDEGLVKTGVFRKTEQNDFWTHYALRHDIPDTEVGLALKSLARGILATQETKKTVDVAALINPWLSKPHNLTPALMELLLAVVLWRWPREVKIYRKTSGAKAKAPAEHNAENAADMAVHPQDWCICFNEVNEFEKRYLQGICRTVTVKTEHEGSFWIYAAKALINWYKSLDPALREPSLITDPELKKFNSFLATAPAKDKYLREFVEKKLPLMLGAPKVFSWEKTADVLIARLDTLCKMLKGQMADRQELLADGLMRVFVYEDERESTWVEGARRWVRTLSPETFVGTWRAEYDALMTALESPDECCLGDLVSYLGYPVMTSWTTDLTNDVVERMSAMRYALDWDYYCRGYREEDEQKAAVKLSLDMIRASGFNREDTEQFLNVCLQAVAWPESLESEEEKQILQAINSVVIENVENDELLRPAETLETAESTASSEQEKQKAEQEEAIDLGDWLTDDKTRRLNLPLTAGADEDDDLQIKGLRWELNGKDFLSDVSEPAQTETSAETDKNGAVLQEESAHAASESAGQPAEDLQDVKQDVKVTETEVVDALEEIAALVKEESGASGQAESSQDAANVSREDADAAAGACENAAVGEGAAAASEDGAEQEAASELQSAELPDETAAVLHGETEAQDASGDLDLSSLLQSLEISPAAEGENAAENGAADEVSQVPAESVYRADSADSAEEISILDVIGRLADESAEKESETQEDGGSLEVPADLEQSSRMSEEAGTVSGSEAATGQTEEAESAAEPKVAAASEETHEAIDEIDDLTLMWL